MATERQFGQHGGQPLDRRRVRGDEPVGERLDIGMAGGDGERLDVARPVQQLVLQLQVPQQRLVERLGLLDHRLHQGGRASEQRAGHARAAAEVAQYAGDRLGPVPGVAGVLGQFPAHRLGAGLGDPGLGDLDLGVGQVEQRAQLGLQRRGGGHSDAPSEQWWMRREWQIGRAHV